MDVALDILYLAAGFALLIKGASVFVDASVGIAQKLHIPQVVIGLTVVAVGTSAPETVVSVTAAASGANDLAVSNVLGSNIFNIMLVVGVCVLFRPIVSPFRHIARDYWVSMGASVLLLFYILLCKDSIPRLGSFVMLAAFAVYMTVLVRGAMRDKTAGAREEETHKAKPLPLSVLLLLLGGGMIVGGGQLTVSGAVSLALYLGVSQRVVGLTVVAIGTSLPELVTSIVACKKGKNDIVLGNVIGSNIFNILMVLGLSGVILPISVGREMLFDAVVLVASGLLFLVFAHTRKRIARWEGFAMILLYAAYMTVIVLQ